MRKRKSKHKIK